MIDIEGEAKFEILLPNIHSKELHEEISKELKIKYLSDTYIKELDNVNGIIYGPNFNFFISLPVKIEQMTKNVHFLISTGSTRTYICEEVYKAFNMTTFDSSVPESVLVNNQRTLAHLPPSNSQYVNILGTKFLHNTKLFANFKNNHVLIFFNEFNTTTDNLFKDKQGEEHGQIHNNKNIDASTKVIIGTNKKAAEEIESNQKCEQDNLIMSNVMIPEKHNQFSAQSDLTRMGFSPYTINYNGKISSKRKFDLQSRNYFTATNICNSKNEFFDSLLYTTSNPEEKWKVKNGSIELKSICAIFSFQNRKHQTCDVTGQHSYKHCLQRAGFRTFKLSNTITRMQQKCWTEKIKSLTTRLMDHQHINLRLGRVQMLV